MAAEGKKAVAPSSGGGAQQPARAPMRAAAGPVPAVTPVGTSAGTSARTASRARRAAMSSGGKIAIPGSDRVREAPRKPDVTTTPNVTQAQAEANASQGDCGCGCNGASKGRDEAAVPAAIGATQRAGRDTRVRKKVRKGRTLGAARAASLARREATSTRGKAGISANASAAQLARAANPHLSGRELAKALREQRSRQGKTGSGNGSSSRGRVRPTAKTKTGAAQDAPWKVGESETASGQTLTGTMVGRSENVTGDDSSTCRSVTGTEYLGADIFREFCQTEPSKTPRKVEVTTTAHGNRVSGNRIGRGTNVTGDEAGTCKRVTGNEYVDVKQAELFCGGAAQAEPRKPSSGETRQSKALKGNSGGRSDMVIGDGSGTGRELTGTQYTQPGSAEAPAKVGGGTTLRGGHISGSMIGRSSRVTGDEPGSCRDVTGDDYIGQEQYKDFCEQPPQRRDRKVEISSTLTGSRISGSSIDRSDTVTGNEPGTCKAVTGTPYGSADQYAQYCEVEESGMAAARTRKPRATPGAVLTGQQPAIGGDTTGDAKGACENVSGTPYVGADQYAAACPATPAETGSPDFPQPLNGAPWSDFSVTSAIGGAGQGHNRSALTGTQLEQGQITGPFGMAPGKVTGTEEARFGKDRSRAPTASVPTPRESVDGRVKSRVTGEGIDAGHKITGDDWDRGDNVTGTEGMSATRRNPSWGNGTQAAPVARAAINRNAELPEPVSKVTGGSGNTERGALVTYSGGARG